MNTVLRKISGGDAPISHIRDNRVDASPPRISQPRSLTGRSLGWTTCLAAFLALLILLAGPLPPSNVMRGGWTLDLLWRESFWQQVSGYAKVALVVAGLSFSLRKRWRWLPSVSYQTWRLVHAFLGAATLLILVLHTGLRLGTGLNFLLMFDYLGLSLTGAIIGGLFAWGQSLRAIQLRGWIFTIHLGLLWVFPTLLGFHILAVYYY